ncbi:MAG: glycosyltransferase family 4 protein [Planctomycetes bacterium]|nr:glycosyltransferase family 4 protein [Planctomycetota bacterium]
MKICFCRFGAYPLFDPFDRGRFGGAEFRAYTFAKGFASLTDHDVSFLVDSECRRRPQRFGRIDVHFQASRRFPHTRQLLCQPRRYWQLPLVAGYKLVRSFRKRTALNSAKTARLQLPLDMDVLCCFGTGFRTFDLLQSVQRRGAKFVLFLVSNDEIDDKHSFGVGLAPELRRNLSAVRDQMVDRADLVVAQNKYQKQQLSRLFSKPSVLIRNPIDLSTRQSGPERRLPKRYVLWVGRADTYSKRADLALDIAKRCPEMRFVMVMNKLDEVVFKQLTTDIPKNVTVIEHVPYDEMDSLYRNAVVLMNTSESEGFPNTFLQAAKHGLPIVSHGVDPNGMLQSHGCGQVANRCMDTMLSLLSQAWRCELDVERLSQAGSRYIRRFHALEDRVAELDQAIQNLIEGSERHRRSA